MMVFWLVAYIGDDRLLRALRAQTRQKSEFASSLKGLNFAVGILGPY